MGRRTDVMRRVVRVRHAADMHELQEDLRAFCMNCIGDLAPASDMFGRVDPRRRE